MIWRLRGEFLIELEGKLSEGLFFLTLHLQVKEEFKLGERTEGGLKVMERRHGFHLGKRSVGKPRQLAEEPGEGGGCV